MNTRRSGQSQIVTAVILAGILITGITAAYVWGIPILQKNQDIRNAQQSLDSMMRLSEAIASVAREGGSRRVTVRLGEGSLAIRPENETIRYQAFTMGAYVSTADWTPLNENDMQGVNASTGEITDGYGIRGSDKPGLVIGRAEQADDRYVTFYRLIFRPLYNPDARQTYQIDLVSNGNLQASGGEHTVVFRREDQVVDRGAGVNGGPLYRTRILIRIA